MNMIENSSKEALINKTLKFIAQLEWKKSDLNFFNAIVRYLGETFKKSYVFVDYVDPQNSNAAKTISLYSNGEIVSNIEYDLAFTPCEQVNGKRLCCYVENVQGLFPKDQLLKDLAVESYIGIPLWDSHGKAIGLIGIMDTNPFNETDEMEQVLQILAVRCAHELEQDVLRKKLMDQLNLTQRVINTVNEGVILYDLNMKYVIWNSFMERLTGLKSQDVIGKTPQELFPFLNVAGVIKNIQNVIDNRASTKVELEFFHVEKQSMVWLQDFNEPFYNPQGELEGVIGTVSDITLYKEYSETLLKAKEIAEQALLVKTEFLANMSHEVRTPINGIYGVLQLLETELKESHQLDYIYKAKKSSDSLLRIVNDILDYSKLESEGYEFICQKFQLRDLLTNIQTQFSRTISEKGNILLYNITADVTTSYYGDLVRLTQILSNLISNANKFTDHGTIEVNINKPVKIDDEKIELTFSVKDTGIGIQESKMPVIFNAFSQADNSNTRMYPGTGLGLSIVKKIIEKNGGQIKSESKIGHGSKFTFSFILYSQCNEPTDQSQSNIIRNTNNDIKVLVVDDDELSSLVLVNLLIKLGYSAKSVASAASAIELLKIESFNLIMMDIQMPNVDGIEALKLIRCLPFQNLTTIPVIAVTAHALSTDSQRFLDLGFNDYLSKPINLVDLMATMKKYSN